MGFSHAARVRTAVLGLVGAAAMAAGVFTGHGSHDGFFLAAAGGFALGIAAALAVEGARAGGRAEGGLAGDRAAPRPDPARREEPPAERAPQPGTAALGALARSTVAAVAHDMSNPLASLRCNLEWLRDALEAGRLTQEQAEAREVLRDANEAAERLRIDVGTLRAAGRGDGPSRLA